MADDKSMEQKLSFGSIQLFREEELGHGSFGIVCKAQCDQLICAAKVIYRVLREAVAPDPGREHRQPNRRFLAEIDFLKHVRHPNIVQYLGTYDDPDSGDLVLLMELMDESLTHFLESSPGDIPYHTQVNISYDIAQALAFLHANKIIHRDLSSNNVLLLAGTRAKVTDFGMSKFKERDASMTFNPGTTVYMPPEALKNPPKYTKKLDSFSFGVLLVQMVTKQFPEPTERCKAREVIDKETNQAILAEIPISEVERRNGHISLIHQDNPLLPIALDCLKDKDLERPLSQELCERLNTVKRSNIYEVSSHQDPVILLQAQHFQQIQSKDQKIEAMAAEVNQLADQLEQATLEIQAKTSELQAQAQALASKDEQLVLLNEQIATLHRQMREILALINMSWRSLEHAPADMFAGSSTVICDKAYIRPNNMNLKPGIRSETLYEFSSSSEQWSELEGPPSLDSFTVVGIESTLTAVGGVIDRSIFSNHLYSYTQGNWIERLPQMPTARCAPGVVYRNNKLVVVGGNNGQTYLSAVEILDTVNNQWSSVCEPRFKTNQPSVCILGDHIYVHPGRTLNDEERHLVAKCSLTALVQSESSSPSSTVWEDISSLPVRHSTLISVNGHLIAVGGEDSEPTSKVYQYNETFNTWVFISQMSTAHHWALAALLPDNKLMVVGGAEARKSIEIATITH